MEHSEGSCYFREVDGLECEIMAVNSNRVGFCHRGVLSGRSMYLPAEWGPRTRETTLLSDSATTTPRAGLGCARMGSPVD